MSKFNKKHCYLMSSSLGIIFIFNQKCSSPAAESLEDKYPIIMSQVLDEMEEDEEESDIFSYEFFLISDLIPAEESPPNP
jgi:hypothetical protein